jgi:hypothetical protein
MRMATTGDSVRRLTKYFPSSHDGGAFEFLEIFERMCSMLSILFAMYTRLYYRPSK